MSTYVYIKSEPGLWTVGFYKPDGAWEPESDHDRPERAAARVHYLNGGRRDDASDDDDDADASDDDDDEPIVHAACAHCGLDIQGPYDGENWIDRGNNTHCPGSITKHVSYRL